MTTKKNELALDRHFWNRISSDRAFFDWFISHSKFAGELVDLDRTQKWHQRWYRDPATGLDSETDITLFLLAAKDRRKYAIHIENKPVHGKWQPFQIENYRKRAENRMTKWNHDDYATALIAPIEFLNAQAEVIKVFDFCVSYEGIARFVPEFS